MASKSDLVVEKFAICQGLGLTVEETAAACGYSSTQSYYNHTQRDPKTFDELRSFTAARAEEVIGKRVGKIKTADTREDRLKSFFDRALAISEKLLDNAEAMGDAITPDLAMEIHKTCTTFAAKYAASEAPKRLEVGGRVEHVHSLLDETANRVVALAEKYEHFLLPPADVQEAELVS